VSEFSEAREKLAAARAGQDEAVAELARARERAAAIEAELAERRRIAADGDDRLAKLAEAGREAASAVEKAAAAAGGARAEALAALKAFTPVADPRERIGELADDVPILLFPLRLEARFKRVRQRDRTLQDQLWVRAYPDTCLVDMFEAELAAGEVEAARRYWQAVWRAAGREAGERAAWRDLVAGHGSGRARWIVDRHVPLNPDDRPQEVPEDAVLLVSAAEEPAAGEPEAIAEYWTAVWRAGGGRADEEAALEQLAERLGDADRAAALRAATRPAGLASLPPAGTSREDATVVAAVAAFPAVEDARSRSWSRPAQVRLLPERLLCVVETAGARIEALGAAIPVPLHVGPDPSGPPQLAPEDGELTVPDELLWMTDFDRAVRDGLGFRIVLTPEQASAGVERLTVAGVRLSAGPQESAAALEELLAHHRDGRSGFSLVAQGTPTNNTEELDAGFTRSEDPDASFDALTPAELPDADPLDRLDGRWLADWLGLDPAVVAGVPGADGTDQREARAMNAALWPGTLGYFLETLMAPVLDDAAVEDVRWFFTTHVSGRGAVPAVRIGAQPYGILPAIAFGRIRAMAAEGDERAPFVNRLHRILRAVDKDWTAMAAGAASLGTPGADPDATLLDVLGLHPASVEFHFRYAESLDHVFNQAGLFGVGGVLFAAIAEAGLERPGSDLLERLGRAPGGPPPEILSKYFLGAHGGLLGDVVDDRPLSETDPVRDWTTDGRNYLEWLDATARTSLEALRRQSGFAGNRPPTALLYLLLRHALMLGYSDAAVRLHRRARVPEATLRAMKREPPFVHVVSGAPSESRWAPLLKVDEQVTGDARRTVAEHIARLIGRASETKPLAEQLEALRRLVDVPTARLERLLAEHVDLCGYRFDAWRLGLVHHRLAGMRATAGRGIHLGAYGWLEDLRPSATVRTPVKLEGDLADVFQRKGDPPLERDSGNGGFVHAPSLDHATTAAVLRAGYMANASEANPEALAVNLSSERVRLAMSTLEGVRNGQSLGALLGYRLERGLHDHHPGLELDRFILPLRKAFPLVADRIAPTRTEEDVPADEIAARNVVDGLRLVEHLTAHPGPYPFGKRLPDDATAAERAAIEAEVDRLRDLHDAIADLMLADGVHQAVQGRYDAAAASLEVAATGGHPPEPEVVRTPRSGIALTHRLVLHLDPGATAAADATPRAATEPRVDRWLEGVLPALSGIACRATWTDPRTGELGEATVSLADLGLRPLDLLSVIGAGGGQEMTELDDRVVAHVLANADVPVDVLPAIGYLDAVPNALRVFDVAAPVARLRSLVRRARPLRPGDAVLAGEARPADDADVALDRGRIAAALADLEGVRDDLDAHAAALAAAAGDPASSPAPIEAPLDPASLPATIDALVDATAALFGRAARFGIAQTGWGFAFAARRALAATLIARVEERVAVWDARLADFDALLAEFDALPAGTQEGERLTRLRRAEMTVSTAVTELPADLADLRAALPAKRAVFAARRAALAGTVADPPVTLSPLLGAVVAELPLTDVDLEPFDLGPEATGIATLARDLLAATRPVAAAVRARSAAAATALAAHDAAATAPQRVQALTQAGQALFGEEFVLVPDGGVPAAQAAEWANVLAGDLTRHLTDVEGVDLPVEEWLTGVARVREQARAWEQVAVHAEAFGRADLRLTPLQFPYVPGDHWLALPFPEDAVLDRDRLLYTASLPAGFDPAARLCGLLLDEWTEVIPGRSEDTGIAAHFERPSSEPPQALLLVTPATQTGAWDWPEVTGALDDTLALARKRAVEPEDVDGTPYARYLPATVMATTLRGISIGLSLAVNNRVSRFVEGVPDA
jgi:hypothetical protein